MKYFNKSSKYKDRYNEDDDIPLYMKQKARNAISIEKKTTIVDWRVL